MRSRFVPTAEPADRRRLLVVLHGRGDSSAGFQWLPSAFAIAGLDYLLVDAPDDYYGGYSWYDLPPHQGPGIERSRGLLDTLLDEVIAEGYEPRDVALFGFSQGCVMTLDVGGRSMHPWGAYVGVSGFCWQPNRLLAELSPAAKRPRWLVTHGIHDEVLAYEDTRQQIDTLVTGGLPVEFRRYDKGHTIDPDEELPVLREFVARHLGLG